MAHFGAKDNQAILSRWSNAKMAHFHLKKGEGQGQGGESQLEVHTIRNIPCVTNCTVSWVANYLRTNNIICTNFNIFFELKIS